MCYSQLPPLTTILLRLTVLAGNRRGFFMASAAITLSRHSNRYDSYGVRTNVLSRANRWVWYRARTHTRTLCTYDATGTRLNPLPNRRTTPAAERTSATTTRTTCSAAIRSGKSVYIVRKILWDGLSGGILSTGAIAARSRGGPVRNSCAMIGVNNVEECHDNVFTRPWCSEQENLGVLNPIWDSAGNLEPCQGRFVFVGSFFRLSRKIQMERIYFIRFFSPNTFGFYTVMCLINFVACNKTISVFRKTAQNSLRAMWIKIVQVSFSFTSNILYARRLSKSEPLGCGCFEDMYTVRLMNRVGWSYGLSNSHRPFVLCNYYRLLYCTKIIFSISVWFNLKLCREIISCTRYKIYPRTTGKLMFGVGGHWVNSVMLYG